MESQHCYKNPRIFGYFSNNKIKTTYRTDSNASVIASSDHGVGFDLDNSIPSRLQRPYNVPGQSIDQMHLNITERRNLECEKSYQSVCQIQY